MVSHRHPSSCSRPRGWLPPDDTGGSGTGVVGLGFTCVLSGLGAGSQLLKVEERKTAARFFLGALFLIGGGLMALGARLAGWWGQ